MEVVTCPRTTLLNAPPNPRTWVGLGERQGSSAADNVLNGLAGSVR